MTRAGSRVGRVVLALALAVVAACGDDSPNETSDATADESTTEPTSDPPTSDASTTTSTTSTTAATTTTTSTTEPPATTAPTAQADAPVVAITDDGDAVYFPVGTSAPTLLYDGPDPDAPPPEEGPGPNVVDIVAVTPAATDAYVGLCCEPIAGSILTTELPGVVSYESGPPMFGYGPAVSPDGRYLATGQINGGVVSITDLSTGAQLDVPPLDAGQDVYSPYDTMWLDDGRLVALGILSGERPSGWYAFPVSLAGVTVTVGDPMDLSMLAGEESDDQLRLAGIVDAERFAVHREGDSSALAVAFESATGGELEVVAEVGAPARTIWVRPGQPTIHVGTDGRLHVGDSVLDGLYRWARA